MDVSFVRYAVTGNTGRWGRFELVYRTWGMSDIVGDRCQENTVRIRQSKPAAGLAFRTKVFQTFEVVPSLQGKECQQLVCHFERFLELECTHRQGHMFFKKALR